MEKALKYCKLPLFCSGNYYDTRIDEKGRMLIRYFDPELNYEQAFQSRISTDRKKRIYEYDANNQNYIIRLPKNMIELLDASLKLHNCLWRYPELIVRAKTHIVFLCDKKNGELCAAIEISNEKVVEQASTDYDLPLTDTMCEVVEEYARNMKFKCGFKYDNEYLEDVKLL